MEKKPSDTATKIAKLWMLEICHYAQVLSCCKVKNRAGTDRVDN